MSEAEKTKLENKVAEELSEKKAEIKQKAVAVKADADAMKQSMKKGGLRFKVVFWFVLLLWVAMTIVITASLTASRLQAMQNVRQNITTITEAEAQRFTNQLEYYKGIVGEIGTNPDLADPRVSLEDKQAIIDQKVKDYGFLRGRIIGTDGLSIFDGTDYSDRDYFVESMKGKTWISEPVVSKVTGDLTIILSAPLYADGIQGSEIVGVVSFIPNEAFLNDMASSIVISESTIVSVINKDGKIIASKIDSEDGTSSMVMGGVTVQSLDAKNKEYADFVSSSLKTSTTDGNVAASSIMTKVSGVQRFISAADVEGSDGWRLVSLTNYNDYNGTYVTLSWIIIAISFVFATLCSFAVYARTTAIVRPIEESSKRLVALAKGDLKSEVKHFKTGDETETLCVATKQICDSMRKMIDDMDYCFEGISNGDLDIHVQHRELYVDDYKPLLSGLRKLKFNLNDVMLQINTASEQVNSGAEQVSSGAQALSQGATEQASSVEELSATIALIAQQIKENDVSAQKAKELANQTGDEMQSSSKQMEKMIAAMGEINDTASQIEKIVKTIDDIAFQTNILALNAAVEAARAGAAGKGFAVVADEVRNLAQKSSEAANNTTNLIERTITAVKNGSVIADETAKSIFSVVDYTLQVADLVANIATASEEQATAVAQVNTGMEQVSAVVQTNSATAEESAAASEELSGQSHLLKNLVDHFALIDADIVNKWRAADKSFTTVYNDDEKKPKNTSKY